jgi:ribosomal protein L7Ae-like RNA K-turn-binding protein
MLWSKSLKTMKSDKNRELLFALGLCAKAGKLIYGVPMVCEALKKQKTVVAVISAADNSPNSAKRLLDRCTFYGVPLYTTDIDGDTLSGAVGKSGRLAALAVTDQSLWGLVYSKLPKNTENDKQEN